MRKEHRKCGIKAMLVCLFMAAALLVTGSVTTAEEKSLTPKEVVDLTKKVIVLLESKGNVAFQELKSDEYIFGETYPVILDLNGRVIFHPIKPHLEGKSLLGVKDKNGKRFVAEIVALAGGQGSGWVGYVWPKPGEKDSSKKATYVMKGKLEGQEIACMIGIYDVAKEDCEKQAGK